MRVLRRLLAVSAVVVLLLLGLGALLLSALSQGWQRERLGAFVASRVAHGLGVEVSIGSLEGPLYPEFEIRGLRVGSADEPLLSADRVALRLDASSWPLERRLVLESLRVEGLELVLQRTETGDWMGLAAAAAEPETDTGEARWLRSLDLGRVEVQRGRLRLRWPLAEETAELAARIDAEASGLAFPWNPEATLEARGGLRVALEPGEVGGVSLDGGELALALEGQRLVVEQGSVRSELGNLRLEGVANLAEARIEQLVLEGALAQLARLPWTQAPFLDGSLVFRLDGAGAFEQPTIALELEARELVIGELALGALRGAGRVQLAREAVGVESLVLENGGQRLLVSGTLHPQELHTSAEAPAFRGLRVEANDLDVSLLGPLLAQDTPLGGRLDASLLADGPLLAPSLTGRLVWRAPRVGDAALERIEGTVSGEAGRAEIGFEAFRAKLALGRARAALRLAALAEPQALLADPATELDVEADSLDVALVAPWLPRQLRSAEGRVEVAFRLRGAEPEPKVEGHFVLADGGVTVPVLRQRFEPIRGRLVFANGGIVLEDARVGSPGAEAVLEGNVALEDLEPRSLALRLAFDGFPLSRSPLLETDVAGDLRLEGPLDQLSLSGQLALDETRISLRDSAEPTLREIRVLQEEAQTPAGDTLRIEERPVPTGAWERARVDVALAAPIGTRVRGPGLQLELVGDLAFRKEPLQELALVGGARVLRGRYAFQRTRFDVRRGRLTFNGGIPADPLLDVEAVHRVEDITVLITVTGPSSAPTVLLSSDPPLPESDVLAYLVFGVPLDQLAESQRMALQDAAGSFAAGLIASEAEMLLEDALPIDTLEIRIAEDGTPEEVSVGKYVSDRVFVRVGQSLGPNPRERVAAEYRLNRNWSIAGDLDSTESAGADLIFTFEY
jgi:autotransporter translocation and assembly factor TamB